MAGSARGPQPPCDSANSGAGSACDGSQLAGRRRWATITRLSWMRCTRCARRACSWWRAPGQPCSRQTGVRWGALISEACGPGQQGRSLQLYFNAPDYRAFMTHKVLQVMTVRGARCAAALCHAGSKCLGCWPSRQKTFFQRSWVLQGGGASPKLCQNTCGQGWPAGDGFVTDQSVVNSLGVSDATPFLSAVVSKPYRNQACQLLHSPCYLGAVATLGLHHSAEAPPYLQTHVRSQLASTASTCCD